MPEDDILGSNMNVLLNILTHGDETAGIPVANRVRKLSLIKGTFSVHRANELAFKRKKRFIDQDLNRSFPGKKSGNHEQKLACAILPIIRSADIVIDIHTTRSGLRDSIIVTKLDRKTREYVEVIQPRFVLIMNATKSNALISEAKVGIGFEYGGNSTRTIQGTAIGIERLLSHLGMIQKKLPAITREPKWFDVHSTVPKPKNAVLLSKIKNYKEIKKGESFAKVGKELIYAEQDFYPILFGNNSYTEIFGFAARRLSE